MEGIPGEFVGLGGGAGAVLFGAVIWFSTKWLGRWTRTQDQTLLTLQSIEKAMVSHNDESASIMAELRDQRAERTSNTKALTTLVERSRHWGIAAPVVDGD